jgi:hypothetical protein
MWLNWIGLPPKSAKQAGTSESLVVCCGEIQQALAAAGAIAYFSRNLFSFSLNAGRAPQLKRSVGCFSFSG